MKIRRIFVLSCLLVWMLVFSFGMLHEMQCCCVLFVPDDLLSYYDLSNKRRFRINFNIMISWNSIVLKNVNLVMCSYDIL